MTLPIYIVTSSAPASDVQDSTLFVENETPTGTIDGANATFTLAYTPTNSNAVKLFLNGATITNGTGATITGTSVVFDSAPVLGSSLRAFYRKV
jgi:hypothetical protein